MFYLITINKIATVEKYFKVEQLLIATPTVL
jgi:hypothetical protein